MIVDPDGELAWFVIPLIVGAVTGGLNVYDQYQKGNLGDWESYLGAFGVGFASGFVATALAPQTLAYFGGSAVAGAGGFIAGAATGGVLSGLDYSIRAIGNGRLNGGNTKRNCFKNEWE